MPGKFSQSAVGSRSSSSQCCSAQGVAQCTHQGLAVLGHADEVTQLAQLPM
jgi:hypothetical protein